MPKNTLTDTDLDALFADKSFAIEEPSADFLERIVLEAEAVQDGFAAPEQPAVNTPFWTALVASIGGWRSIAGLATATVVGVWIGINPPSGLDVLTDAALTSEGGTYAEYLPDVNLDLIEGQL